jgi:ABC1 atypical kinase-like domain
MKLEQSPLNQQDNEQNSITIENLLNRLPQELQDRHTSVMEEQKLSEDEMVIYLREIIHRRIEAKTESVISDTSFEQMISDKKSFFDHIETVLRHDRDAYIGNGTTALIQLLEVGDGGAEKIKVAVKYLVNPNGKTLTAAGEHDIIREVEQILQIERLVEPVRGNLQHIRVPHPYFHHKKSEQCYGMEYVDGYTVDDILQGKLFEDDLEQLKASFSGVTIEDFEGEVNLFFEKIHQYCHHGDIKPKNMMLSKSGKLYLIDFGQSYLMSHIPEKARSQEDNLADAESKRCKDFLISALKKIRG